MTRLADFARLCLLVALFVVVAGRATPRQDATPRAVPDLPGVQGQLGAPQPFPRSSVSPVRSVNGEGAIAGGAPLHATATGSAVIAGWATYFDSCRHCAAAGPQLRAGLGSSWRGREVDVCAVGRPACTTVRLVDSCACGDRRGVPTIIDLDRASFAALAPTSAGLVRVSIELPAGPAPLPRTDAEPPRSPADIRMFEEVRNDDVYR